MKLMVSGVCKNGLMCVVLAVVLIADLVVCAHPAAAWDGSKAYQRLMSTRDPSAFFSKPFVQRFTFFGGRACPALNEVSCSGYLIRKVVSGGCQVQPTCCGDGKCDLGESPSNCPKDCFQPAQAKDVCPKAEYPYCKGRYIYPAQVEGGCPISPTCCGDGVCQSNEGVPSCPEDCARVEDASQSKYCPKFPFPHCVGFYVYPEKTRIGCTGAPVCCGNNECESPVETGFNCPSDCGKSVLIGSSYKPFDVKAKETYRESRTDSTVLYP